MQEISSESLEKGYRVAMLIGFAMVASVFVYAGIAEYLSRQNAPFAGFSPLPKETFSILRLVLLGASLLDFALLPVLRKSALNKEARVGAAGFPEPVARLLSASLVSFALCESIAIYGLILFLLNGARHELYLFIIVSLAAYTVYFPRIVRWREYVEGIGCVIR